MSGLDKIVLAIDTSDGPEMERLFGVAKTAAVRAKLGLELATATSWGYLSRQAEDFGVPWIADAKLHDIPNTVAAAVRNLVALPHPPFAITMHASAGEDALRAAQQAAGDVMILAVTVLTSIPYGEAEDMYVSALAHKPSDELCVGLGRTVEYMASRAASAEVGGVVCSAHEIAEVKPYGLFCMVPGTRSAGADAHDQKRTATPGEAIAAGADLLVIGRQVTASDDPFAEIDRLEKEIEAA